ncbi:hypothetical protein C8J56DRAFT_1015355 [Mycena floridula]|nr:hypothetical protein C8J56DRAFT_1015355 [Mycena floridula]
MSLQSVPEDYELLLPEEQAMGRDEQRIKPEGRKGDVLAQYAAFAAAATILFTTWVVILTNQPFGWFALHPLLQSSALFMITYGIVTLQPTSQPVTKASGLSRHQLAMLYLALPLISVGTFAVFYNKVAQGKDHFVTWHGVFGIISMAWIVLQILVGGGSVWFGGRAFGTKAKSVWKYHRLSGYILFSLVLLTVNLGGAWSDWSQKYTIYPVRLVAYTVAPLAILAGVLVRMRLSKMKFT